MAVENNKCILPLAREAFQNHDYLSALQIYKIFQKKNPELKPLVNINIKKMMYNLKMDSEPDNIKKYNDISLESLFGNINAGKHGYLLNLLWKGYSNIAIEEIKKLLHSSILDEAQQNKFKYQMFKFYYASDRYSDALNMLDAIKVSTIYADEILLLKVMCHIKGNNIREAISFYYSLQEDTQQSAIGQFIYSTLIDLGENISDIERLKILNNIYRKYGLSEIALVDDSKKLELSNIYSPSAKAYKICKYKVSIIMPAYNAHDTIETAITSILAQTWSNIEVIVVDDCSTDNTADIVKNILKKDDRVHLLQQKTNQGCYPARNAGLAYATGDFITIHDSDDWAHPQRIATQVNELLANPQLVGNYSLGILTDEFLKVRGAYLPFPLFRMNSSSFLFRHDVVKKVGYWDTVRFGGDTEFIERIRNTYGRESVSPISMQIPLSFILTTPESLTRNKKTSLLTLSYFNSARYLYRQLYSCIYKKYQNKNIKNCIRALKKEQKDTYDFIIVTDFSMVGSTLHSSMNYMKILSEKYSVAILLWARHDLGLPKINKNIFDICSKNSIDILSISDSVKTKNLIFYYPVPLRCMPDFLPDIDANRIFVTCSQYYKKYSNDEMIVYDPKKIHSMIIRKFEKEPKWVAISGYIKDLMMQSGAYPNVHDDIWAPPIECSSLSEESISWEGDKRTLPIIGRHGRDSIEKWPEDIATIKKSYLVGSQIKVRLMGGVSIPRKKLGYTPKNWEILKYNEISVDSFCKSIDFLVHFPHSKYIEAFGRVVIDAMICGKVVILPPVFERTFGDAALYCTPGKVEETVRKVWGNKKLYIETAKKGINFAKNNCSYENVIHRFTKMDKYDD